MDDRFLGGQLAVFVLAVVSGILFRYVGLPSLIGQVTAGFLVGISGILGSGDSQMVRELGSLGITLLLFLVGLELNWKEIKRVGKASLGIFAGQTVSSWFLFLLIAWWGMGLDLFRSGLLAVALTFSSTIVVVKMLSEKRNLSSLSGRLSLGILLLQDLLAVLLLAVLPSVGKSDPAALLLLIAKMIGLFVIVDVIGHAAVTWLLKEVIKTGEDLVLFSLAWFMVVILLSQDIFGVPVEVGSFLAGLSLSTTWGHFQIINKVKTLRDIFLTLFFVSLGMQVGFDHINLWFIAGLSLLIVASKFFLTYFWSLILKVGNRVAFLTAINMTQVSEFGMVVAGLGMSSGLWGSTVLQTVTVTGLFTMTVSTMLIGSEESLFVVFKRRAKRFFRIGDGRNIRKTKLRHHVVLLGCDRTGRGVMNYLKKNKQKFVVVDFNPDVVAKLAGKGGEVIFADASDPDVVRLTNMREAKLIISTIKDKDDSLALLATLKRKGIDTPVIVDAETLNEAKELYSAGASYVVFPHFVSGWHMNQLIKKSGRDKDIFYKYRSKQEKAMQDVYETKS